MTENIDFDIIRLIARRIKSEKIIRMKSGYYFFYRGQTKTLQVTDFYIPRSVTN